MSYSEADSIGDSDASAASSGCQLERRPRGGRRRRRGDRRERRHPGSHLATTGNHLATPGHDLATAGNHCLIDSFDFAADAE